MDAYNHDILVKVENISKKFCRDLKTSLWYGMRDLTGEFLGNQKNGSLRPKEFYAVNDISFELRRGECLGLIGHNGAGKSTLLKMLNGLIKPDKGTITMKGRIGALIELGAGFNPLLTGRENIYINGQVLGFTQKEIHKKFDAIVDFSGIEEFIDTPVQNYSSGMKVRLGFSVASQLEPDVLILDEVLAVGDAGFRIKSFNKISEIIKNSTVLFVSHSMPTISRICNCAMYMNRGNAEYQGKDVNKAIEEYFNDFSGEKSYIEFCEGAEIDKLDVYGGNNMEVSTDMPIINYGDDLYVELGVTIKAECNMFDVMLQITDKDMKIVGQFMSSKVIEGIKVKTSGNLIRFKFPNFAFIDGEYSITVFISEREVSDSRKYSFLAVYRHFRKFKMTGLGTVLYAPVHFIGEIELP